MNTTNGISTDLLQSVTLRQEVRRIYENLYRESLYQVNESDRGEDIVYDGQNIKVYYPGTDFAIVVKGVSILDGFDSRAAIQGINMETYKEAWNDSGRRARFKTVTSYMTPENVILLSGGLKYFKPQIIFCFSDGIGSEYSIDEIYSVDAGTPYILEFCTGDSEILYNELVINTASQDEKRNSIKMQLSYIVYIQENSQEDKANNTLWEESQKAAQQFGIPIVVRDREKIQLHERQQIIDGCRCEGAKDQQRYARFIKCLYSLLNGLVK